MYAVGGSESFEKIFKFFPSIGQRFSSKIVKNHTLNPRLQCISTRDNTNASHLPRSLSVWYQVTGEAKLWDQLNEYGMFHRENLSYQLTNAVVKK